jgi:hypothetical protein
VLKVAARVTRIRAESALREDQQYFYCACEDKTVKYYCMPLTTGDLDIVGVDDVESSAPDDVLTGHPKAVTAVELSPNQVLLASGCAGGSLTVRELDVKTAQVQGTLLHVTHHNPFDGAISAITFAPDGRKFFTVGFDGVVNMYAAKVAPTATPSESFEIPDGCYSNSVSRTFQLDSQLKTFAEMWGKRTYDMDMTDPCKSSEDDPGWDETSLVQQLRIEKRKTQAAEATAHRDEIMKSLTEIREEFMTLVEENESAPELEKLTHSDFTLDTPSAERLQQLAQLRVALVHYRRRIKHQIRALIGQAITDKCFKPYEPRLTTLFSFKTPIHFDNFPMPVQGDKYRRILHCVALLRRTEVAALRYRPGGNDPNRIQPTLAKDMGLDGARYLS